MPQARNLGKDIVIKPNETQPPVITDITKKPSYYDGSGSLEAIVKK
ncbi:hypothetical protein RAC89_27835 [Paenibacillus sp. GD4]|nr:hypothetical protein [Paenibacillus sp. GD4]MDQ1914213.1 hypothetical protein [Paenibacillus sp. GD4]